MNRDPGLLREVRPGDRPSASQHNLMIGLLRRKHVGDQVCEFGGDTYVKPHRRTKASYKPVRVTAVQSDRLRVQEIRVVSLSGETDLVGPLFDAAPWPGQLLADYQNKELITMLAIKLGMYWCVLMTGDRQYTEYPTDICDTCAT